MPCRHLESLRKTVSGAFSTLMSYAGEPPRFPATFFIHENFQNGVAGPTCPSSKSVAVEHEFLSTKWTGIHTQEVYFVQVTHYSCGCPRLIQAVIIPIG